MNFRKKSIAAIAVLTGLLVSASPAFAHVVVSPNQAGVAQRVNFAVGVPTEEDVPTVGLRLVIPEGLKSVTPNVKSGWNIEVKKTGEGEDAKVTEIIWTGGEIPAGQRDEFVFRAMTPSSEAELQWKAYQTYQGGKVVAWDKDQKTIEEYEKNNPPKGGVHDENAPNPFSVTKVVNDLAASNSNNDSHHQATANKDSLPTVLSIAALVMSAGALYLASKKKK